MSVLEGCKSIGGGAWSAIGPPARGQQGIRHSCGSGGTKPVPVLTPRASGKLKNLLRLLTNQRFTQGTPPRVPLCFCLYRL